ncbi:hypothetical protein N9A28_09540 [Sulfurimonas sp.]|nr:hypothetical protein [Sulfurimonas sp.]
MKKIKYLFILLISILFVSCAPTIKNLPITSIEPHEKNQYESLYKVNYSFNCELDVGLFDGSFIKVLNFKDTHLFSPVVVNSDTHFSNGANIPKETLGLKIANPYYILIYPDGTIVSETHPVIVAFDPTAQVLVPGRCRTKLDKAPFTLIKNRL